MSQSAGEPRICAACGAKSRADRRHCLRCGAELVEAAAGPSSPALASGRSRTIIGATAAIVLVGALLYGWRAPRVGSPESSRIAVASSAAASRAEDAPVNSAAAGKPERSPAAARDALFRGNASYKAGDMDAALASFRHAVEANPADPEALNNLAQVLERTGRPAEAVPLLRQAIERVPDRWSYRFNLAHALGRTGDWNGAVREYREADRLFPDDHVTLFNLGLALQKTGNHAEAIEPLSRAVALAPAEPDFLLPLAQSYLSAGQPEEGRRTLEQYLTLAPNGPDAALVRATLEGMGTGR